MFAARVSRLQHLQQRQRKHLHIVVAVEGDGGQACLAAKTTQHHRVLVLCHMRNLNLRAYTTITLKIAKMHSRST